MNQSSEMQGSLEYWEERLAKAEAVIRKKAGNVKRAETALHKAESDAEPIRYARDMAMVQSWNGKPDVDVILSGDSNYGAPRYSHWMYEQSVGYIRSFGLGAGLIDIQTNQKLLNIHFENKDASKLNQVKQAIEHFLPYLKVRDGYKYLSVSQPYSEDFAIHLKVSSTEENCLVCKCIYGNEVKADRKVFGSLHSALYYIQHDLSGHDYLDEDSRSLIEQNA